jgi:hypothetical protein
MVEAQGMPYSVSSDQVVERVKNLCHVVGLLCEGFGINCWLYFLQSKQVHIGTVQLVV